MVKPGYKQTEVGVIPENWECVPLLEKTRLLNGLTYTPENVKEYGLLVLRSSNVQNSKLSFEDTLFVDCVVSDEKKIKEGDILVCVRNGSAALIGKCAQADRDYDATFGAFMAVLRGEHNDYIHQILQQGTIQKEISKNSGATINQITNGDFKLIWLVLPGDKDEEKAIAEALSHVDRMISAYEKLILKKKAIKQGAMQELLTGKKRLPGFSGEWQHSILGNSAELSTATISTKQIDSRHYVGTDNMVADKGGVRDNEISLTYPSVREYIVGDVLLSNIRPYLKKIWHATRNGGCSNDVLVIRSKNSDELNSSILYYLLSTDAFFDEIMANAVGTKMPRGDKAVIRSYAICYPKDILEQKAIAEILSNMDAEIEALEQKLEKYRQIKQGMMQQLLTGKIRLV